MKISKELKITFNNNKKKTLENYFLTFPKYFPLKFMELGLQIPTQFNVKP